MCFLEPVNGDFFKCRIFNEKLIIELFVCFVVNFEVFVDEFDNAENVFALPMCEIGLFV